jgi:peptidoglycan/xylan/chitin deacetylase (PgdA/CDA1 family)
MSEDELAAVPTDAFEIGSHTVSHPFLDELPSGQIRRELADSRSRLQDITGTSIDTVSIPNGAIDGRVRQIALDVGYQFVFTSEVGVNFDRFDLAAIRRVAIHRNTSLSSFRSIVAGDLGNARRRQQLLSIPKRVLGSARYRALRKWALGETSDQGDMSALVTEAAATQPAAVSHSFDAIAVH